MPKIFITGSNESKGTKTGSGYLSNPSRVLIRDRDNKGGRLPTKLRIGTKDRLGNELISYDDNNSIRYGRTISDTFTFTRSSNLSKLINPQSNIWSTSPGIKIKRQNNIGTENYNDGALVFSGPGDASGRWIQTKEKVRNPTLILTVFQGPYLENTGKLDLSQGIINENLKIQISETGSSGWINVAINDNNVSNPSFIIDGVITPSFNNLEIRNPENLNISRTNRRRPLCKIKLDMQSFKMPNNSFYIRIIQENIVDRLKSIWAIDDIKIISRNDSIAYPFLLKEDFGSHKKFITGSLSTPNFPGNLIATGSTLKSVTNKHFSAKTFETKIDFFYDNNSFDFTKDFYQSGIDESSYPGFSSNLGSKDIIEVDLSIQEEIDLLKLEDDPLNAAYHAITGSGDLGSNHMVYWNNNLKKWEKIGWPLGVNDYGENTSSQNIINVLSQSAIGFSSVGVLASGSGTTSTSAGDPTAKFLPDDLINSYNRPTDIFGFPFSARYHATGSQYVLARDIGITKPFLFEKASLDFEMSGRVNSKFGGAFDGVYMQNKYYQESTSKGNVKYANPTFFILRQKKESFQEVKIKVFTGSKESDHLIYKEKLPRLIQLKSGSSDLTFVDDSRELISYGQHTIVMSSSFAGMFDASPSITFQEFLNSPIVRQDRTVFTTVKNLNVFDAYFTGSFQINFKARNTAKISAFAPYYIVNTPGGIGGSLLNGSVYSSYANIRMGKQHGGRSSGEINQESRAILNGYSAFNPTNKIISIQYKDRPQASGGSSFFTNPVVVAANEGIDLDSPYIIMPNDKLIFGWQAPLNYRRISAGSDTSYITLLGNSKLKLFGSLIQNNKEFHEGLNQYLTSDSVYETIGNDSVLDQFQLTTRGELTGSILSEVFTNEGSNRGAGNAAVFGSLIFPNFVLGNEPFKRIGSLARSSTHDSFNLINDYSRGLAVKNSFNIQSSDLQRKFSDCFLVPPDGAKDYEGNILFNNTDGVFVEQGYGFIPSIVSPPAANSTGKYEYYTISPQYSFNSSHFGYFSDLIQQGKDSKFVDDASTTEDDLVTESPVQITFVKSEIIDNTTFKRFRKYDQDLISGTSELEFQSLNLDINSKSSSAFYDDGVIRDRVYSKDTTTVSWGFNEQF